MEFDRRRMLRAGLAGAGGLVLSSPLLARRQDAMQLREAGSPPVRVHRGPAIPTPKGVNPALIERARAALDRHAGQVRHRDSVGLVDFDRHSSEKRFHLVHMASGTVESFYTTHGRGSDRGHTGYLQKFSNTVNSLATSSGAYVTANQYRGKYGLSMKLHGLDFSNSNAWDRAIVMHPAWYAEADMVRKHGKLGRSEGCFAFGQRDHWLLLNRLGDGRLIYADKLA